MDAFNAGAEFDRQVRTLLDRGYPELTGLDADAFAHAVAPLREVVMARGRSLAAPTRARVPFVVVVNQELAPADRAMPRTALKSKPGFADFASDDIARFRPIEDVSVPDGPAYLVFDIDRGAGTLNVTPEKALTSILEQGRTPLTVAEGIAFITHFPESLEKNNCFSLAGSRCGDRRVPALWISKGAPKLGWCWAGNPHTWLGSASCAGRAA